MNGTASEALPERSEAELRRRQARGRLRVRLAADYRQLVREQGLAAAYAETDVVVAANAEFTDQASLHLSLGPTDPPIRLRDPLLEGVPALAGGAGSDLVLPLAGGSLEGQRRGGAQVLASLLAGESIAFSAAGEVTPLQPRPELNLRLDRLQVGQGRLLLHRAISENGVVAVSSAEGVVRTPWGPLLGPWLRALHTCAGAGSIGLTMPGLSLLGPGSPLLVAGAIGWVVGSGSAHQPGVRRLPSGHARAPGATAAVSVDLEELQGRWLRACFFEGHGSALLVAIAAPVPLIHGAIARQAAADDDALEAPVLDLSIPRRLKPGFGGVPYSSLKAGTIQVDGRRIAAAPAHSPRLAAEVAEELADRLRQDRFPLRLPLLPLNPRPSLLPLEA
ncbi:MAG: homocysteine biosynthesis protein [Synechococcus sp.]|nr:homocysteine biosynthesis protein [Synechococcus sp.]